MALPLLTKTAGLLREWQSHGWLLPGACQGPAATPCPLGRRRNGSFFCISNAGLLKVDWCKKDGAKMAQTFASPMLRTSIVSLSLALLTLGLPSCGPEPSSPASPSSAPSRPPAQSVPTPDTPLSTVQSIIARQLGLRPESIKPESTFASLGADDLDVVEIVMATEEAFDITIPDEALGPIQAPPGTPTLPARLTVGAFVTTVSQAPKAKFSSPKLDEPHDGTLRLAQVGPYQELSQLPNPRGYELVFVPELSALEAAAAQKLGQKLTEPERVTLKNKAIVMAMPPADAAKFKEQRAHSTAPGGTVVRPVQSKSQP